MKQKNPSLRNSRWLAILNEYNVANIKHLSGSRNIVPDILSRMKDSNIESKIVDDLPWMVQSMLHQNNNIVTRSKAGMAERAPANHTPSLATTPTNQTSASSSQRMQTAVGESHEMAANDVSNDVIDLEQKQQNLSPTRR